MATLADALVTSITTNYGGGGGGGATPANIVNLNAYIETSPFNREEEWIVVWIPSPAKRDPINEHYANVTQEVKVLIITPTSDDRLKEIKDELIWVINNNAVTGINYQWVGGDIDRTDRRGPTFMMELTSFFLSLLVASEVAYSASSTPHLHDGDILELDGIDSNGGAFPFTTTGPVTFNQDVTVANLVTAGNVDGVDVSEEPARITAEIAAAVATENELSEMNDVTIAGIADNHVLTYDSGTTKWINEAQSALVLDGATIQIDGVNSDGGAFAFNTTGGVLFNQWIGTTSGQMAIRQSGGAADDAELLMGGNRVAVGYDGAGSLFLTGKAGKQVKVYSDNTLALSIDVLQDARFYSHLTVDENLTAANIITAGNVDGVDVSSICAFKTITGITNNVVADSVTDSLTLASGNNKLTIVGTTVTDTITYTLVEANIDHDALTNFAANEHFTEASISHDNIADVSANDHHAEAHTHNGDTLQADAFNSNGGAFAFNTTGIVTFNQNVTVPNLVTAGNVDGVDVSVFKSDYNTHIGDSDKHAAHSGISIIAGTGMSGGGSITQDRTLNCDITQYTDALARTACVSDAVYGAGWNAVTTIAPSKNAVYDQFVAHDVANRHIDHSGVTISAGIGLSGGGTIAANRTINCDITQYTDALARTACVQDAVYGVGWNEDTTHAPSQNAVYDTLSVHYADSSAHHAQSHALVTHSDLTISGISLQDALMYGSSNVAYTPCVYFVNSASEEWDQSSCVMCSSSTTNQELLWELLLPTTKGALKLHVDDVRFGLSRADSNDYVDYITVWGIDETGRTQLNTNPGNWITAGEKVVPFAAVNASAYHSVRIAMGVSLNTTGFLQITGLQILCYYTT